MRFLLESSVEVISFQRKENRFPLPTQSLPVCSLWNTGKHLYLVRAEMGYVANRFCLEVTSYSFMRYLEFGYAFTGANGKVFKTLLNGDSLSLRSNGHRKDGSLGVFLRRHRNKDTEWQAQFTLFPNYKYAVFDDGYRVTITRFFPFYI